MNEKELNYLCSKQSAVQILKFHDFFLGAFRNSQVEMRFRGLRADTFVTGSTNGSLLSKFGALHFARLTKSESIIECTVFGKC